ncbi:MAG: multicopper oxidase domain-containing protein [Candidatus Sulfotelmatobacter sp.]|jgi:FtsP/CotA-like multicopper oxidase with cupredoxin domain
MFRKRLVRRSALITVFTAAFCLAASSQVCPPRPAAGSTVQDQLALYSQSGALTAGITMGSFLNSYGLIQYCFAYPQGSTEAPTLELNPGDDLTLNFSNQIQTIFGAASQHHVHAWVASSTDPDCNGEMTSFSSNIHFHGMNLPPKCHADETIFTLINPGDPTFTYRVQIPTNEPPGLYWYHPHAHGLTQTQIMGGASGALIVEGIEKIKPEVAGLTERVLVLRDQYQGSALNTTINFVPGGTPAPVIEMQPSEKQFWRVANAEGETFVSLQVQINGQPQKVTIVALDGTPVKTDFLTDHVNLPPAGRAEFIVQGPAAGQTGAFVTLGVNTGLDGVSNPPALIANIVPTAGAKAAHKIPASGSESEVTRFAGLLNATPTTERGLYFSENLSDVNNIQYFITVDGQTPHVFEPTEPPAIVTTQGAVEEWTIENRAEEVHAFHIHQVHFIVVARDKKKLATPEVLDTVEIPAWTGSGPYHSVTLKLDFRDPETVGTFVYHCHILAHEDGGMMAKIQVNPAN